MFPKVVTDAGYTAVGLGVLAVQQVQTRRRETRSRVSDQIQAGRQGLESALGQVKAKIEPFQTKLEPLQAKIEPIKARLEAPVSAALGRLTHVPGPLGGLLASGRDRIQAALHSSEADEKPPARHAAQGKAKKAP
jgi:hypothetical protein